VEASRKHGPFDTRWPGTRRDSSDAASAPPLRAAEATEALDWDAFAHRYFHERSRHDSGTRSAYAAYRQRREWRTTPARLSLVPADPDSTPLGQDPTEAEIRRLPAAVAAMHAPEA
jgi:hypothetical protein